MIRETHSVFFHVPTEKRDMVEEFFHHLLAEGALRVIGYRGEGSVMSVSENGVEEIPVLHYRLVIVGDQEKAGEIAKEILSRGIVPSGKAWMVATRPIPA